MVGCILVKRFELHLVETLGCPLYLLDGRVEELGFSCDLFHLLSKTVLDLHEDLADEDHVFTDFVDVVGVGKDEVDIELPPLLLPGLLDVHPGLEEALLPPFQHSDTVSKDLLQPSRRLELDQLDGIDNPLVDELGDHEDEVVYLEVGVETLGEEPDVPEAAGHARDDLGDLVKLLGGGDHLERRLDGAEESYVVVGLLQELVGGGHPFLEPGHLAHLGGLHDAHRPLVGREGELVD